MHCTKKQKIVASCFSNMAINLLSTDLTHFLLHIISIWAFRNPKKLFISIVSHILVLQYSVQRYVEAQCCIASNDYKGKRIISSFKRAGSISNCVVYEKMETICLVMCHELIWQLTNTQVHTNQKIESVMCCTWTMYRPFSILLLSTSLFFTVCLQVVWNCLQIFYNVFQITYTYYLRLRRFEIYFVDGFYYYYYYIT